MSEEKRRERLRFRSWHRGTREMDLLMGAFADAHLGGYDEARLDLYEALLGLSDPDLFNWVSGAEPVPPAQDNEVLQALCAFGRAGRKAQEG